MLQITAPASIFNKQKVFSFRQNVEKREVVISASPQVSALVIYNNVTEELPAGLKNTADKIIQACKLSVNQSLFLNAGFTQISLGKIQSQCQPQIVLVFGDIPLSRNLPKLAKNHAYEIGGTKIIRTETLENLESKKGEKATLWSVLQTTLGIK